MLILLNDIPPNSYLYAMSPLSCDSCSDPSIPLVIPVRVLPLTPVYPSISSSIRRYPVCAAPTVNPSNVVYADPTRTPKLAVLVVL